MLLKSVLHGERTIFYDQVERAPRAKPSAAYASSSIATIMAGYNMNRIFVSKQLVYNNIPKGYGSSTHWTILSYDMKSMCIWVLLGRCQLVKFLGNADESNYNMGNKNQGSIELNFQF